MRGVQTYSCNDCGKKWSGGRREKTTFEKEVWGQYVFNKQTLRELGERYNKDRRTLRDLLDKYQPPQKTHRPRELHLVVDATYWGERLEQTSWCSVVARDPYQSEDLWWSFEHTETTSVYLRCRLELEALGYKIHSVTGDGFSGLRKGFWGIPFQMCLVHMERIVIRGTTMKPELEAGEVLLAMVRSVYNTDLVTFEQRLSQYIERFRPFLNERTVHPVSGRWSYTHEDLRAALNSLISFRKLLFTFEQNKNIPKTTNSLEGHFRHINEILAVHCGLERTHKEKVLHSIFLAGTIAPSKKRLDEIL